MFFSYFVAMLERVKDCDAREIPLVLVGNKADMSVERQVRVEEAQQYADKIGAAFVETSAKLRLNVDEAFSELVCRQIIMRQDKASRDLAEGKKLRRRAAACAIL